MRILAINPGSTSTKLAVYNDEKQMFACTVSHPVEELAKFNKVADQYDFRKKLVLKELSDAGFPLNFDAVIGRGGLLKPIQGGIYEVNELMREEALNAPYAHACNLGCLIASALADMIPECRAFIADPGVVDEMDELPHITGSPLLPRVAIWHALNQKAIARRFAREHAVEYESLNLIVCHMGGGISIGAHSKGKAIDVNNALDGEGPFSPERAGTLPAGALIDLCFSGKYSQAELKRRISGQAGLAAHLGTTDVKAVVKSVENGDVKAGKILHAMIYQIAKSIGAAAIPLLGKVDAILLTGGMAYSDYIVTHLKNYISFLGPVYVYPGENELESLALNALAVLRGERIVSNYI